ncbi:MAG TPA: TIGR00366 family protein [Xanthomonadaceae bacterium]|nr:TIGR00366 family protein [Xanthomonadaceae bacterium]
MTRRDDGWLARIALRCAAFAERWFPDAWVFAALGVVLVAFAALASGATPHDTARAFGQGYWSLVPFTLQMVFVVIGGYVVASAPVVARGIGRLARLPRSGRGAVAFVAALSMLSSLLSWGFSLVFGGLLVRALARRADLRMDYRAAGAAAYLGLGAVWALGLSSSAAQLQANPASMPKELLAITGVLPFAQTIFLWQSLLLTLVLVAVSVLVAWRSAPDDAAAVTAQALGVRADGAVGPGQGATGEPRTDGSVGARPGDWLERSPLLTVLLSLLAFGWLAGEFASRSAATAIADLNTYNLLFLSLGLLLHWRPRSFLDAVAKAVPGTAGVLIQFPLYGGIAAMLTGAAGADGATLAQRLAQLFVQVAARDTFVPVMGAYSAVLGFFVPSGGGKWLVEAPYVMQAANALQVHLGWAVQTYNAAEALPNLVNPFWMLPLLGILGLKARDLVGYTFVQLLVHVPLVLGLLWLLGLTLSYLPPAMP